MIINTPSTPETKRKQAIDEAGHWELPLDGHGLSYFEEMEVEFRTLPPPSPASPYVQALKLAKDAEAACEAARNAAENAKKAVAASPGDQSLQADAVAKENALKAAEGKREEANKAAALAGQTADPKVEAAAIIIELINRKARGGAIWSDILVFESALLRLLPFDLLKTKLLGLRQEYRDARGGAAQSMEAGFMDLKASTVADFPRMQAEAVNLLAELHWNYTTAPQQEWQKIRLTLKLGGYTALVCAVIFFISLGTGCSTVSLVMLSGALGAALSAFQRIQDGRVRGAPLLSLRKTKWGSISVGVAPLLGVLSALLLAFVFAGNLLQGALFPRVTLAADGRWTNQVTNVSSTNIASTLTNAPSLTNTVSVTNPPGITRLVSITNTAQLTNLVSITNTSSLTNPPAVSSDPATWRDRDSLCQHHWAFASGADLALLLV